MGHLISFRYHAISLVAVFLALAVGVVLGSGPLHAEDEPTERRSDKALAAARSRAASLEAELAFSDAYSRATADQVLAGRLDRRTVTILTLPGADKRSTKNVGAMIASAGGSVVARMGVEEDLLDVANRQLVAELATQMQSAAPRVKVPEQGTGYERIAALLAHALVTSEPGGATIDSAGRTVLAGLDTAGFTTADREVTRRANLVAVVGGGPYGTADQQRGAGTILADLLKGLDEGSAGVVLTGPAAAAGADGLVDQVRTDASVSDTVSTVSSLERPAGAVVTVLALVAEASGTTGHYGAAGSADGAVPKVLSVSPAPGTVEPPGDQPTATASPSASPGASPSPGPSLSPTP